MSVQTMSASKYLRRATAVLFVPLASLLTPIAAHADSTVSASESAAPKVDIVLNSPEAQAERVARVADAPSNLASLKARAAAHIASRQRSLLDWSGDMAAAKGDCGQNAGANSRIAATQQGLAGLGGQIAVATDLAVARALYGQIFTQWRVYLVVAPAVHIPLACGAQSARSVRLLAETASVRAAIDAARAAGADTITANALLGQVQPLIDQARALSSSASASAATLVPDLGNDAVKATNAATVTNARNQIKAADALLDQAARLLRDARESLKTARQTDRKADHEVAKNAHEAAKDAREQARDAAKNAREVAKDLRQANRGKKR